MSFYAFYALCFVLVDGSQVRLPSLPLPCPPCTDSSRQLSLPCRSSLAVTTRGTMAMQLFPLWCRGRTQTVVKLMIAANAVVLLLPACLDVTRRLVCSCIAATNRRLPVVQVGASRDLASGVPARPNGHPPNAQAHCCDRRDNPLICLPSGSHGAPDAL